jgi:hypothetical protein
MVSYARHELDIEKTLSLEHRCRYCASTTRAVVQAVGMGTQLGGSMAGPTEAQRRALERQALADLGPDARESLGLVPCPKCRRRNVGTIVWVSLRASMLAVLVGIVVACFGIAGLDMLGVFGSRYSHHDASDYLVWAVPIFLVSTLALEALIVGERMVRAKKAVRFVDSGGPVGEADSAAD